MYFFNEKQVDFATAKRENVLKKLNGYVDALAKSWEQVNEKPVDWRWKLASYTANLKSPSKEKCQQCVENLQNLMQELQANLEDPKTFNKHLKELSELVDNNSFVFDGNDAQKDFVSLCSYLRGSDYSNNTLGNDLKKAEVRSLDLTEFKSKGKSILEKMSKDVLMNVFGFLDIKSLLHALQTNRFMAGYVKNNQFWETYIKNYLTQNPKLLENETYYNYIKRHRKILLEVHDWSERDFTDGEEIFVLLFKLTEMNLEKLFITVLKNEPYFRVNDRYVHRGCLLLIHCAVSVNNIIILNELIKRGANLELKYFEYGQTNGHPVSMNPLQIAAQSGSYESLNILLNHEVNVNAIHVATGFTALHFAASHGHLKCVQLLVENNAKLAQKSKAGNTPYQLAKNEGHSGCADYLAEKMQEKNIDVPNSKCLVQ